jgi:hypothetical protein
MEFGAIFALRLGGDVLGMGDPREFGDRHFEVAAAPFAERRHLGQVDRQIVADELEHARLLELRRIVDEHAIAQAEDDRVGIVGRHELAMLGGHRQALAVIGVGHHEDAGQLAAAVAAAFDPHRHPLAQLGELADLDRRAERARSQFEAQPLIGVARIRLDEADDRQVEQRERDRIIIRHPEQPAIAHADRAQHVDLGRHRQPAKGEQATQRQPDRDAERHIFGDQIGEHPPDHADRTAFGHDEIEQPQHLVERQQHRGDHQRAEQRRSDQASEVAVGKRAKSQLLDAP